MIFQLPPGSIARKCTLPKRILVAGGILPRDALPKEISVAESNGLSLRAFVYDYCLASTNENLSQGFLSGVERMILRLGPRSDLAKACQAVAFAGHGKPLNRPQLIRKGELLYHELLGSLARAIEFPYQVNFAEAKLVALLLGLYQVFLSALATVRSKLMHACICRVDMAES
jgi:hypothetical protein